MNTVPAQQRSLEYRQDEAHADTVDVLCGILRGESFDWSRVTESDEQLLHALRYHGVEPLLHGGLKRAGAEDKVPVRLYRIIEERVRNMAICELMHQRELSKVLAAFDCSDVHPLLMKGTPLAYTHYASPALRPRGDTDILVKKDDLHKAAIVLENRGYEHPNAVSGEFVTSEQSYMRTDQRGICHALDVHWRINNALWFARALSVRELYGESIPVPALGKNARTLGTVHALLLACIHRISHIHAPYYTEGRPHYGGNRLIWLYDIHVLGESMDRQAWDRFILLASQKRLADACLDGLSVAQQRFKSAFPADILTTLAMHAETEPLPATKLVANKWRYFASNFKALPSWSNRLTLLQELLLPPSAYVHQKFQIKHRALLPFLYAYRIVTGIWKKFRN